MLEGGPTRALRLSLAVLAVLSAVSVAQAAPAPAPDREAKEKLEALKKRLPGVFEAWAKAHPYGWESNDETGTQQSWRQALTLRRSRLVASDEARLTLYAR